MAGRQQSSRLPVALALIGALVRCGNAQNMVITGMPASNSSIAGYTVRSCLTMSTAWIALLPLAIWERADAPTSRTDVHVLLNFTAMCRTGVGAAYCLGHYADHSLESHNRSFANSQQYSRCLLSFSPCLSPE